MSAVTVLITFAFVAEEIRAFLGGLLKPPRTSANTAKPLGRSDTDPSVLARPLMFMFLLTWALPLSFVPLYARSLPIATGHLPSELAMALPTSAEMACAFCTTLLSGWLSDRRGWHVPVFFGLLASSVGGLASAIATDFEWFVASRAITGLGYGLTWMGIQGFVVRRSAPQTLTFSIANMTAGIFTGHMVGTIWADFSPRPRVMQRYLPSVPQGRWRRRCMPPFSSVVSFSVQMPRHPPHSAELEANSFGF